tara:strand:- start:842 stop:1264 length:423 start_codon:yes stop_codon:yes gene_type:complete
MTISTSWSVQNLGVLTANGFVDEVKYLVRVNETEEVEGQYFDASKIGVGNSSMTPIAGIGTTTYTHIKNSKAYTNVIKFAITTPEIAYADLTENTVIGWVKAGLGSTEVSRIEDSLAPDKTEYNVSDTKVIRLGDKLPWS